LATDRPSYTAVQTTGPLLTLAVHEQLIAAARRGDIEVECSLDLQRSQLRVRVDADGWIWNGQRFAHLQSCKPHTIYHWVANRFEPVARFSNALYKLVPTPWGPPTFEIDGIKMLPSERLSPFADAENKVDLIHPRGKVILDTCGGLGYFAAWCLDRGAARILSFEKSADVLWLRSLNPWSPQPSAQLSVTHGDVQERIAELADSSVGAILHDPPRFGIAGELYSLSFYRELARVLQPKGLLFHYVGTPNKLTSGRDVPKEVMGRLVQAGFEVRASGDGVLGVKRRSQLTHTHTIHRDFLV
jgi:predicted methyltransferase